MEASYKVVELFESINGEGTKAGQLAVFVRFAGCNLNCSYCDTRWANEKNVSFTLMTAKEIKDYIESTGINNITLTGGEPLLQEDSDKLLSYLCEDKKFHIEIETNGSVPLPDFSHHPNPPVFTMDYKLPGSGMEHYMNEKNFTLLSAKDTVKFVVSHKEDLKRALFIINKYDLTNCCHVYLSPVFGKIDPKEMVSFMKEHCMNGVNLQLQLHKFIWNPNERGV